MKFPLFTLLLLVGMALAMSACYYDNEEYLYPVVDIPTCDTSSVTYANTVVPVLQRECYACHGASAPGGGINLTTYAGLKRVVDDGSFYGSISHNPNWSKMPQGGNKLPDCELSQIEAWINQGAANN